MKGKLEKIRSNVYYEDLDSIYERFFEVDELPKRFREAINELGDLVFTGKGRDADSRDVGAFIKELRTEYPNSCTRYNVLLTKAEMVGEQHDKNKENEHPKGACEDGQGF